MKIIHVDSALANRCEACQRAFTPLRASFALGVLVCTALVLTLGWRTNMAPGLPLSLAICGLGALVAAIGMRRSYPHAELGLCNLVTLIRLALTASLAALLVAPAPVAAVEMWHAFGIAVTALLLDGVDGWAARRAGLASRFGARFDLEVDSLFALTLALLAWRIGEAGPWVLVLGLPRYLFLTAGNVWPHLRRELPDRRSRKAVCVLQLGTLVAFLVPVLPPALPVSAAVLTLIALTWSFLRDVRLLTALDR